MDGQFTDASYNPPLTFTATEHGKKEACPECNAVQFRSVMKSNGYDNDFGNPSHRVMWQCADCGHRVDSEHTRIRIF